jgi:hypothetical protein
VRLGEKRQARSTKVARLEALAFRQSQDQDSPAMRFAQWCALQQVKRQADGSVRIEIGVDLRAMMQSDIPEARQILRGFLKGGQIVLTPEALDVVEAGIRVHSVAFALSGDLADLLGRMHARIEKFDEGPRKPRAVPTNGTSAG